MERFDSPTLKLNQSHILPLANVLHGLYHKPLDHLSGLLICRVLQLSLDPRNRLPAMALSLVTLSGNYKENAIWVDLPVLFDGNICLILPVPAGLPRSSKWSIMLSGDLAAPDTGSSCTAVHGFYLGHKERRKVYSTSVNLSSGNSASRALFRRSMRKSINHDLPRSEVMP